MTTWMNYQEYRDFYAVQNPSSVPQREVIQTEYPGWLQAFIVLMFISAAVLSGVHTIPTVRAAIEQGAVADWVRELAAIMSFAAIELAIFVTSYARLKSQSITPFIILVVAFLVAVAANIYSVSKALGAGADAGAGIVTILLGVGAPLITLMAGEMLVRMNTRTRLADAESVRRYREAMRTFDQEVNAAWAIYEERREATGRELDARQQKEQQRLERLQAKALASGGTPALSASVSTRMPADTSADGQPDSRTYANGQGYTKNMSARTQAREHLLAHRDQLHWSARRLESEIGICGKSVWAEVIKAVQQEIADSTDESASVNTFSNNGHSGSES